MNQPKEQWLARAGVRVSEWFEHRFPDAFAFAVIVTGYTLAAVPPVIP